ncbi:MAG: hypothetical protein IT210_07680 [Armatimonadetes bacterium]|nr:hypothetical protein [Armatimonadota bacterium]
MIQTPKLMYNYRGVYDQDLTHEVAYFAGLFTGEYYRERSGKEAPFIMVGNDHRFSSNSIKHYLVQGLIEANCSILDVGCLPTSVVSYLIRKKADGGCVVTASHNPPEHNGIKCFDSNGGVLKPVSEEELIARVVDRVGRDARIPRKLITRNYAMIAPELMIEEYVKDLNEKIRLQSNLKVAVDCRLGTAYVIMPALLESFGCETRLIHDNLHPYFLKDDGTYLNPEPKEDNIPEICYFMEQERCDIGLIFDGDSDRNVIVDNRGHYVPDDIVLLLLALEYASPSKPVVATVDTSLMVERELTKRGYGMTKTPVGDPFVSAVLEHSDSTFGGVPNGHYIFPDFNLYSDGIYSAAVILRYVAKCKQNGRTLSEMLAELPRTYLSKSKYPFGRTRKEFTDKVAPRLQELFAKTTPDVDYLKTDDCVVVSQNDTVKLMVRYNRWDNNFNVQAESLNSREECDTHRDAIIKTIKEAIS